MQIVLYRYLRWLLVHTNRGALRSFYRWVYARIQGLAVWILRRQPGVVAIYARRGMARGQIIPGISDIDMMLVSNGALAENPRAYRVYGKLARWIPVLEKNIMCHARHSLQEEFERRSILRHAWGEVGGARQLLWGEDPMAALKRPADWDPGPEMLYAAAMSWQIAAGSFLERDTNTADPILASSVAARIVGELALCEQRLLDGLQVEDRWQALRRKIAVEEQEKGSWLASLMQSAESGYRKTVPKAGSECLNYLVQDVDRLMGRLARTAFGASSRELKVTVDAPPGEVRLPAPICIHLSALAAAMQQVFAGEFRGLGAAPVILHRGPSWAAMVDLGDAPENLERLRPLIHQHLSGAAALPFPVPLYLRLPHGAVLLNRLHPARGGGVLSGRADLLLLPFLHLDYFHLLGERRDCFGGEPRTFAAASGVSSALSFAVREALWVATNRSHVPFPEHWAKRHPLRDFWWILQLKLLAESLTGSGIHFAMSPEAVVRRLQATGRPLAPFLPVLCEAAGKSGSDARGDVRSLLPQAADFLEEFLGPSAGEFQLVLETWRGKDVVSDWRG